MKSRLFLVLLTITIVTKIHGYNQKDFEIACQGGKNLNLIKSDLSNLNTKKNLIKTNLNHADLTQANIKNTNLSNANLEKALLYKTNLFKTNLSFANLRGAKIIDAKLNCTNLKKADFYQADLTNSDFSGKISFFHGITLYLKLLLNLEKPTFKNPEYKNRIETNFKRVKAINTNFSNANLIAANFEKSYLTNAKFNHSILAFANFSNIKSLRETDFRGALLFGADFYNTSFENAIVKNVDFYGVKGLSEKQKKYLVKYGAKNVYTQEELEELESSATQVQSVIRGYLTRKEFKEK
ncbi:pentapeptide repeat-containing protein [Candidatus Babeliales bacterium]|nr:pentapeptide repeat-containing protein [Candidatus Babeliales bacterium]